MAPAGRSAMVSPRTVAAISLVLGMLLILVPRGSGTGAVALLLGALPYVTLFLASPLAPSGAAVAGAGIALLAVDLLNKMLAIGFPDLLGQLTGDGQQRLWIYDAWGATQPPASTVFVLPPGWIDGTIAGRLLRIPEDAVVDAPAAERAPRGGPGITRIVFWCGVLLVFGTTVVWGQLSLAMLLFAVWAMLPYALHRLLGRWVPDRWALTLGGIAILAGEAYTRVEVFLLPRSSIAPLLLIFSPVYLAGVLLPAGMGAGWLLGRLWHWLGAAGRGAAAAVLAACVLLGPPAACRTDRVPGSPAPGMPIVDSIGALAQDARPKTGLSVVSTIAASPSVGSRSA